MKLFQNATFRKFAMRASRRIAKASQSLAIAIGRYRPIPPAERVTTPTKPVTFKGDAPLKIRNGRREQIKLDFKIPRPPFETVENLVLTPAGDGWVGGALYERYSATTPGPKRLLHRPRPAQTVDQGIFVQSHHTVTFGDWNSEYLATLGLLDKIDAPLYLPQNLASRPYVRRDMARLGVDARPIATPTLIKNAKVVRQRKYIRYWTPKDIEAFAAFIKAAPPEPRPGSILYLSRHGERSEVLNRTHPNLAIEDVVNKRGGRVLRTAETSLEDYLSAAAAAETLLFDHGSAAYNMIHWRPRRIIEFASDTHWMNSFLMFADAMGVEDYTIIRSDVGAPADVAAKTAQALDQPIETADHALTRAKS